MLLDAKDNVLQCADDGTLYLNASSSLVQFADFSWTSQDWGGWFGNNFIRYALWELGGGASESAAMRVIKLLLNKAKYFGW